MPKKKIVIVEDEASLQTALVEWLEELGYETIPATDAKAALEVIPEQKPDLILLDLILPGMSGIEVLSRLKKSDKTKAIPVIVLTNLGDEYNRKRALELGASSYLVKAEHDLDSLGRAINQAVADNEV